jgi:hypothetical protein
MQDTAIKPLEDIAAAYADVRDQRMALNKDEHDLKQAALKLMKKYGKVIYRHEGIEIRVVPGEEDVKVKVRKPGEAQPDDEEHDLAVSEAEDFDGAVGPD